MAKEALKVLYPNSIAVRGDIKVEFKEDLEDGVAGVVANVISQITGATDKSGFKGLNGRFSRHSLMNFNADIDCSAKFTRIDTNSSVEVIYNPSLVASNPNLQILMQKVMKNNATKDEITKFGELWQERVQNIFKHTNDVITL